MTNPPCSVENLLQIVVNLESTKLLCAREAAEYLGVSVAEVRRWATAKLLPVQTVGKRFVFSTSELARWQLQGLRCFAMKPTGQFLA